MTKSLETSRLHWPFQRHSAAWLPTHTINQVAADVSPLHPLLLKEVRADSRRLLRFRISTRVLEFPGILALCLLGGLLTARAQDPWIANTNYPLNTNASLGATVSFRVMANTAYPPLRYQWQHEGTNLPAATNVTLVLTNLTIADAGGYMAWVSNASGGFTNSRTAILTVDPTFTKITTGPVATDRVTAWNGAWGDYDDDGRLDLMVFGDYWNSGYNTRLYHNDGNGLFSVYTNSPIYNRFDRSSYTAWVDFENDGRLDLFVTAWEGQRPFVYRNQGNRAFIRQEVDANWTANRVPVRGSVIAWGDYDDDGFIDAALMVSSANYPGGRNALLHNKGDGTFDAVTNAIAAVGDNNESCAWIDYDNDGDLDLIAIRSSGSVVSQFYRNDGSGQFVEATPQPLRSEIRLGLGGSWADFDNDGDLDFLFRGFNEPTRFYLSNGDGTFVRWTGQPATITATAWGNTAWGDYDNDGYLDLFLGFGDSRNRLFRNLGNGNFEEVLVGSPTSDPSGSSISPAWVDYNGDGALDLFVARLNQGPSLLYRNNLDTNHWLKVNLKGVASNRTGTGARVFATASVFGNTVRQMRQITAQSASQELEVHFGLGDATNVTTLRIEWPSGNVQELSSQSVDRIVTVTEQALITPVRPTASLGASISLISVASGLSYQWRFDGVDLVGQTSRILTLTNLTADMAGRYSVVVSNATTLATNFTYLQVDPTFIKITTGHMVTNVQASDCASWFDYDNDDDLDLFVAVWSAHPCLFYQNNGDGTFTKVTNALTQSAISDSIAGSIADVDNDGLLDLLLARNNTGVRNWLFRNTGGGSWLRLPDSIFDSPSIGSLEAAWVDYDRDGFVDVFNQNGYPSRVNDAFYRNLGNGTFHKVPPGEIGLGNDNAMAFGCARSDYDSDGWPDVFLAQNDGSAVDFSGLFRNDGHGMFSRVPTNTSGIQLVPGSGLLGPGWIDYDSDGLPDLFLTTWPTNSGEMQFALLYRNLGNGTFTNVSSTTGIVLSKDPLVSTGGEISAWGDYDNDGFIDLLTLPFLRSSGPGFLYRNLGNGVFQSVPFGSPSSDGGVIQNVTWADINNDGFLDLFLACGVANTPERNHLYQNNGPGVGNTNHWLKVKLEGRASNRAAIGAKVRVQATIGSTPRSQLREVSGNFAILSREVPCLIPHFGLGDATNVTTLRIEWPSGIVQELQNVAPNQCLTVVESQGYTNAAPTFSDVTNGSGGLQLSFTEPAAGVRYILEASTNLVSWTKLMARTSTGTTAQFTDTGATNYTRRFYRLQVP